MKKCESPKICTLKAHKTCVNCTPIIQVKEEFGNHIKIKQQKIELDICFFIC